MIGGIATEICFRIWQLALKFRQVLINERLRVLGQMAAHLLNRDQLVAVTISAAAQTIDDVLLVPAAPSCPSQDGENL